jgi:hypothetical protein
VQVDPIKSTLKAPGAKRLKLKYDEPLAKFAFNFNLRRYNREAISDAAFLMEAGSPPAVFGEPGYTVGPGAWGLATRSLYQLNLTVCSWVLVGPSKGR